MDDVSRGLPFGRVFNGQLLVDHAAACRDGFLDHGLLGPIGGFGEGGLRAHARYKCERQDGGEYCGGELQHVKPFSRPGGSGSARSGAFRFARVGFILRQYLLLYGVDVCVSL